MAEEWYYTEQGQQRGPVSEMALREMASGGQLARSDLVWKPGMPIWLEAGAARGFFPEGSPDPVPMGRVAAPVPVVRPVQPSGQYPTNRPVPRKPTPRKGMSATAIVILVLAIVAFILLVVGVGIGIIVMTSAQNRRPMPPGVPPGAKSYTLDLGVGQRDTQHYTLERNAQATVVVTNDRNTDVDLYVYDLNNVLVAVDNGPQKDCFVTFVPQRTGLYRFEVVNLGDPTRCHVRIDQRRGIGR